MTRIPKYMGENFAIIALGDFNDEPFDVPSPATSEQAATAAKSSEPAPNASSTSPGQARSRKVNSLLRRAVVA